MVKLAIFIVCVSVITAASPLAPAREGAKKKAVRAPHAATRSPTTGMAPGDRPPTSRFNSFAPGQVPRGYLSAGFESKLVRPPGNYGNYKGHKDNGLKDRLTQGALAAMKAYAEDSKNKYEAEGIPEDKWFTELNRVDSTRTRYNIDRAQLANPTANGPYCPTGIPEGLAEKLRGHKCTSADQDRLTCMACNIYFEARNQSYDGMVAVGMSVVTRQFNHNFPPTACGVIYQKAQYSWTAMSESDRRMVDGDRQMTEILSAAKDALCSEPGTWSNYLNPAAATDLSWYDECRDKTRIGDHVFCRFYDQVTVDRTVASLMANERGQGQSSFVTPASGAR